jgi:trimeric autotransporter adhesin
LEAPPTGSCDETPLASSASGSKTYRVEFPAGKSINDIVNGSISVWCRTFGANFGEVIINKSLFGLADTANGPALECSASESTSPSTTNSTTSSNTTSASNSTSSSNSTGVSSSDGAMTTEISLGALVERDHQVAGVVVLLSDRVLEIRNFSYDGKL